MESKLLETIGIDPGIILIAMFVLIIILFFIAIRTNMKYNRLKASYTTFMRGKNGTLEDSIFEKFSELDNMVDTVQKNRKDIRELNKNVRANYQKVGIVKYDAFNEMGGKLSFAIALLDGKDSGFILKSFLSGFIYNKCGTCRMTDAAFMNIYYVYVCIVFEALIFTL